jgi:hypothetical protein
MRRSLTLGLASTVALVLACASGDDAPTKKKPGRLGEASRSQAPPAPLEGRSRRQICSDPSLALVKWSFERLQGDFSGTCCGEGGLPDDSLECSLDWPFNDVPQCEAWARMRNGIYARHGYPFKEGKWRTEFERKSWYTRREDFEPGWLGATAAANIQRLKENESMRIACTP